MADNNNIPPGHCSCDLTDSKCQTFMVTVKDNITQYNAWKVVSLNEEALIGCTLEYIYILINEVS